MSVLDQKYIVVSDDKSQVTISLNEVLDYRKKTTLLTQINTEDCYRFELKDTYNLNNFLIVEIPNDTEFTEDSTVKIIISVANRLETSKMVFKELLKFIIQHRNDKSQTNRETEKE